MRRASSHGRGAEWRTERNGDDRRDTPPKELADIANEHHGVNINVGGPLVIGTIAKLTKRDSGKFLLYDGSSLPW